MPGWHEIALVDERAVSLCVPDVVDAAPTELSSVPHALREIAAADRQAAIAIRRDRPTLVTVLDKSSCAGPVRSDAVKGEVKERDEMRSGRQVNAR